MKNPIQPRKKRIIKTRKSLFLYNVFMKYIIFDFNGTILDDVDVCLKAENETIRHFALDRKELTKEEYLHILQIHLQEV